MPEDMRTRLRYPEGIFALQAAMYATYHMTNPAVFYNKEDLWEVPNTGTETQSAAHAAVLRDDAAAGRAGARVHSDAALHAGPQGQPRVLDGRPQRRRALRAAARLPVSKAEGRLRSAADRGADQSGPGDRSADHALESAGLRSAAGHVARHSDPGIADLHPPALPALGRRTHPGAETRDRRAPEPDRDGRDARPGAGSSVPVRGRTGGSDARFGSTCARSICARPAGASRS